MTDCLIVLALWVAVPVTIGCYADANRRLQRWLHRAPVARQLRRWLP